MLKEKKGTHNSATGESGHGLLSWLVTPFSRCQHKTLIEQYDSGVRYFDLRVRYTERGLVAAHGLWESEETLPELLRRLDAHASEDYYIALCYEGEFAFDFTYFEQRLFSGLRHCRPVYFAEKKPKWRVLKTYRSVPATSHYVVLDFRSWHTYLPIPWLWKKLYYDAVEYDTTTYKLVDFI